MTFKNKILLVISSILFILTVLFINVHSKDTPIFAVSNSELIDTSNYILKDAVETYNMDSLMTIYNLAERSSDTLKIDIKAYSDTISMEQKLYMRDWLLKNKLNTPMEIQEVTFRNKTQFYFIHCTASIRGKGVDGVWLTTFFLSDPPKGRGWSRVGYSGVIEEGGRFDTLRPYILDGYTTNEEMTYGVSGLNSVSKHFAYVGGVDKFLNPEDNIDDGQTKTLINLIREIIRVDPDAIILGHTDAPGVTKACPSFNLRDKFKNILDERDKSTPCI